MRSDSRNYTTEKSPSRVCYCYPEALSKCTAWTSDWVNQNPPQHVPIMPRTTEKNFDDFVTYPKALSNCIAWTSAWVNQKGHVTCSYNVTHKGKITISIFFTYSQTSISGHPREWANRGWPLNRGFPKCSVKYGKNGTVTYIQYIVPVYKVGHC